MHYVNTSNYVTRVPRWKMYFAIAQLQRQSYAVPLVAVMESNVYSHRIFLLAILLHKPMYRHCLEQLKMTINFHKNHHVKVSFSFHAITNGISGLGLLTPQVSVSDNLSCTVCLNSILCTQHSCSNPVVNVNPKNVGAFC